MEAVPFAQGALRGSSLNGQDASRHGKERWAWHGTVGGYVEVDVTISPVGELDQRAGWVARGSIYIPYSPFKEPYV